MAKCGNIFITIFLVFFLAVLSQQVGNITPSPCKIPRIHTKNASHPPKVGLALRVDRIKWSLVITSIGLVFLLQDLAHLLISLQLLHRGIGTYS